MYYKLRQNTIKDSKVNGKWFAQPAYLNTISYKELCEHMAEHGTIYTKDICVGVGMKLLDCILEKVKEGYRVEFGDFGAFCLGVRSKGTDTVGEFSPSEHLVKIFLKFQPNRSKGSETISPVLTSRVRLSNINTLASPAEIAAREQERQEQEETQEP